MVESIPSSSMPRAEGCRPLARLPVAMPTSTANNMAASNGSLRKALRVLAIIPWNSGEAVSCWAGAQASKHCQKHTIRVMSDVIKQSAASPATIWKRQQVICHDTLQSNTQFVCRSLPDVFREGCVNRTGSCAFTCSHRCFIANASINVPFAHNTLICAYTHWQHRQALSQRLFSTLLRDQ